MLDLAWYCPSEGDGAHLGTLAPERPPAFEYLLRVVRAAERAGAREILIPTGAVNDSFAPDAPFAESWTTAAALAARTRHIRLIVAVNPAGISAALAAHQAETLERIAPGRIAVNLVAGGGPDDGYGHEPLGHDERYARLEAFADTLRTRFRGPLYLGGASEAARRLAARVVDTYLMWGEPPDEIAARIDEMRSLAGRPMRFGLRIHIIARRSEREARAAAAELLAYATRPGGPCRRVRGLRLGRPGADERDSRRRRRVGRPRPLGRHPVGARRCRHRPRGALRPGRRLARPLPGGRRRPRDRVAGIRTSRRSAGSARRVWSRLAEPVPA